MCGSTMDVAVDYALTSYPDDPHVIIARTQEKGRGKPGRTWVSAPGNLYATLILPIFNTDDENALPRYLPFIVVVALGDALRTFGVPDEALTYKWPNDMLWKGQKIGGILIEKASGCGHAYFLIGIGLNLTSAPEEVLATCVQDHGVTLYPDEVVEVFMPYFFDYYENYRHCGFASIKDQWLKYSFKLNQSLYFKGPNAEYKGVFRGITDEGALMLELESGLTTRLYSGDVIT